jgi:hypothetical protein
VIPAPGDKKAEIEAETVNWASAEAPLLVPKKVERSEEKREIKANLEKQSERLTATLSAACSRKKKRKTGCEDSLVQLREM